MPIHEKSKFYDVPGFKAGKSSLKSVELTELGNVSGKTLLHLQCHFGLDTLSWARLGATVTGVDFSDKAIELAQRLGHELSIESTFIRSDVYELPDILSEEFDIVFTSYGVLCWLPDVTEWGKIVASFVKPGGTFYMVEHHPFMTMVDPMSATEPKLGFHYFHSDEPLVEQPGTGTYADPNAAVHTPEYEWTHSLGDIINALVSRGLQIEFLHEFPFCDFQAFPFLKLDLDGWWRFRDESLQLPLLFSLKASK